MLQELLNFVVVLVSAVAIAGSVGALYANGLRLWAAAEEGAGAHEHVSITRRTGSAVCFGACAAIVLFALWLMVPAFH
jgi:hypothetical protein